MTDTRQHLLHVLSQLSELCPEMRMGQLTANLAALAKGTSAEAVWDVEDEELLAAARKQLLYFQERQDVPAT
jgi:hypothetical protein